MTARSNLPTIVAMRSNAKENAMHIAATGSTAPVMQMSRTPESKESRGPDHDGDVDDGGHSSPVSSALPPSTGKVVDVVA
jgi:actin-like ATPase involved in cell morphogenesis